MGAIVQDTRTSVEVITLRPDEWLVVALGLEMGVKLACFTTEDEAKACVSRLKQVLAA